MRREYDHPCAALGSFDHLENLGPRIAKLTRGDGRGCNGNACGGLLFDNPSSGPLDKPSGKPSGKRFANLRGALGRVFGDRG